MPDHYSLTRALIIANGELPPDDFVLAQCARHDVIVLCDGAANRVPALKQEVVILGDFDSIDREQAKKIFPLAQWHKAPSQARNDLEKAIEFVKARQIREITIIAGFGGRLDMSCVTLSLMIGIHTECDVFSLHHDQEIRILSPVDVRSGRYAYLAEQGDLLSLVSFSADAMVTIRGVDWPLENAALPLGSGGVSNRASGGEISITVHHGVVGVFSKYQFHQ